MRAMLTYFVIMGLLILVPLGARAQGQPEPLDPPMLGMWYDPSHDGHGFDLQRQGETWFLLLYTYDGQGEPIWFIAAAADGEARIGQTLNFELLSVTYDASMSPGTTTAPAGTIQLHFAAGSDPLCNGSGAAENAILEWNIGDDSGRWCVQPLRVASGQPAMDFSGHWYAGAEDNGWGLTFYFQGNEDGAPSAQFVLLYYYDSQGIARWAIGSPEEPGAAASVTLQTISGYCMACEPIEPVSQISGSLSHGFAVAGDQIAGTIELLIDYPGPAGGQWQRDGGDLFLLSDPAPRLLPLPATIAVSELIAIEDVTVAPLLDDSLLRHQTVLIEDGAICQIGHVTEVDLPANAAVIGGRSRYLMPGLADMHTHLSVGNGLAAVDRNGLVSVLGGVTTSLNMGDGYPGGMVSIRNRWLSGQAIGPTLYLGKTAYGPNDNALRDYDAQTPATIDTAQRAAQYAESIASQGYDYIKVYNTLSESVINVLHNQGNILGLPVIGHAPKSLSFQAGLDKGQVMVAHIAEVYFTYFSNSMQDALLEPSAQVVASRGVYQTATISTSEVFAGLYGGNTQNFNQYVARPGSEWLHPSVRQAWSNSFNGSLYRPPGAMPGQLDARYEFFQRMVLAMVEGGALVLGGSDAPGHPGLVPGFAMHEEIRIMVEAGISVPDALATVTRNPGLFISETLEVDDPFGTVQVGQRADLLLLDKHPFAGHQALTSQQGVLLRGAWYSQDHLLGLIAGASKTLDSDVSLELHPHWCSDH